MSQVTPYNTLSAGPPPEVDNNKNPKTTHYFWKLCTWLCSCCMQTTAAEKVYTYRDSDLNAPERFLLETAVDIANISLKTLSVQVVKQISKRDFLLEVRWLLSGESEKIDIITPQEMNGEPKATQELAREIENKVAGHLNFKELVRDYPHRYFITKDGCKIELGGILFIERDLTNGEAYLKYGKETVQHGGEKFNIHRAHSYTQIKTTFCGRIRMYDDYDEVRIDGKSGFYINIDENLPDYMTIVRN
ncbi:MAG TPA: hypothetical protein VLG76_08405 [Rhabdochlamydiaceae bacterium]|nr:hypothetical protein [Rhabdochlamydiaceae bacterium]